MNKNIKPKIAVMGGGIFGTTCALLLGEDFSVEIFERHGDILKEASYANQYRHHMGYHYPRSKETVREVRQATKDFEELYRSIIISTFPAYYCISKEDSLVSRENFLAFADALGLPYENEYPNKEFLNPDSVSLCIKTPEAIYDYDALKFFIKKRIQDNPNITLNVNTEVLDAKINNKGLKVLTIKTNTEKIQKEFDYVINATYSNYNTFCDWLGFSKKSLEFRLKEVIIVKLETSNKCAVTIMDGPFTTIVPTGKDKIFTFGDVPLSIHKTYTPQDNLPMSEIEQKLKLLKSKWPQMQKRCENWIPIIKKAEYIDSMFVVLPIESEQSTYATDARPTGITPHGSGCWSILSGKIITCVSTAKKILSEIKHLQSNK